MSWLAVDEPLIVEIASRFDLRAPNAAALGVLAKQVAPGDGREVICDLATGVGKTYLAAALVEYLALSGVRNVLIVTPGTTIQNKTVANFTPGSSKFVSGASLPPMLITSENFARGEVGEALFDDSRVKVFVFNVQQLIRPTVSTSRKVRDLDEFIGQGLYSHLETIDDLVVVADEHHVYRSAAKAFNTAIQDLKPRCTVGLTATPDKGDLAKVVYRYTLAEAIADGLVKVPVIVYRQDGIKDHETQLADACQLRRQKEIVWLKWAEINGRAPVVPVLFVVCQSIADAETIATTLSVPAMLPGPDQVLLITSQSSDAALAALESVEDPASPVRPVVSVDKLKEGWDVKNIGVIVAFRALASETLTEQILGRGLRLPFGARVGIPAIDQVDLVAHDSYRQLLAQKQVLLEQFTLRTPVPGGTNSGDDSCGSSLTLPTAADIDQVEEIGGQGTLRLVSPARIVGGEVVDGTEFLQLTGIEQVEKQHREDEDAVAQVLFKVASAPTIRFPRRERDVVAVTFSLSAISNADAQSVGAGFEREFTALLVRREIHAERDAFGEVGITERRAGDQEATQRLLPVAAVRSELEERIWDLALVEQTIPELNAASRIVDQFLLGACVTAEVDVMWGERRASQAVMAIAEMVRANYQKRALQPQFAFHPIDVPIRTPMPGDVGSNMEDFIKRRWYGGWTKSIQQAANFDAKTTEWKIAHMIDVGRNVDWWLRLYTSGEVWIELDDGARYFPDFIVLDTEGVYWVVEGKSDSEAESRSVLAKKLAAEQWARTVRDDGRFGIWRYLFATETNLRRANTWEELLIQTRPER